MRVIPARAMLSASEPVLDDPSRWNQALGDAINTVVLAAVKTLVHRGTVVLKTVLDIDNLVVEIGGYAIACLPASS